MLRLGKPVPRTLRHSGFLRAMVETPSTPSRHLQPRCKQRADRKARLLMGPSVLGQACLGEQASRSDNMGGAPCERPSGGRRNPSEVLLRSSRLERLRARPTTGRAQRGIDGPGRASPAYPRLGGCVGVATWRTATQRGIARNGNKALQHGMPTTRRDARWRKQRVMDTPRRWNWTNRDWCSRRPRETRADTSPQPLRPAASRARAIGLAPLAQLQQGPRKGLTPSRVLWGAPALRNRAKTTAQGKADRRPERSAHTAPQFRAARVSGRKCPCAHFDGCGSELAEASPRQAQTGENTAAQTPTAESNSSAWPGNRSFSLTLMRGYERACSGQRQRVSCVRCQAAAETAAADCRPRHQ